MLPYDILPYNKKTDANQFFVLNGPFYFTFKEPYVSNPLPIFVPLPASTETKPTQVVLPLMTNQDDPGVHEVKVLPESSPFSNPEAVLTEDLKEPVLMPGTEVRPDEPTLQMKTNLTGLMPTSIEKNATSTEIILMSTEVMNRSTATSVPASKEDVTEGSSSTEMSSLPNSPPMVPERKTGSESTEKSEPTEKSESTVKSESTEKSESNEKSGSTEKSGSIEKSTSTEKSASTEKSTSSEKSESGGKSESLVQEVSRQKTFEEHLEDFLRCVLD